MSDPVYEISDDGIYTPNGEDDYDLEPIPNSWVDEKGTRHAVIWDKSWDLELRVENINGKWQLREVSVF